MLLCKCYRSWVQNIFNHFLLKLHVTGNSKNSRTRYRIQSVFENTLLWDCKNNFESFV